MRKIVMFFVFFLFLPIFVLAESPIIISQVQITGGTGKTAEDFIELFNPSDTQENLNGFRLVKRTASGTVDTLLKSWTTDTFIPPGSFYLWANSGFTGINKAPDTTTSGTISDNNGIALRLGPNDTGSIINSVSWGTANNSFTNVSVINPEANMALVKQDLYQANSGFSILPSNPKNSSETDSSYSASSSPPQTTSTTTPETATTTTGTLATTTPDNLQSENSSTTLDYLEKSSYVKIYRFLPNPAGEDGGNEWVELQNLDEKEVLLDGWLIDDKDIGSGPGTDAFILSGTISPGETKKFILPTGSFALNNSGGDEVNLYFSDESLSQKAVYSAVAYDDGIFEFRESQWQPPAQNPPGNNSSGSSNSSVSSNINNTPAVPFKFNEIFSNPPGEDAGKEWVEIYNPENATTSLEGYFLADGESDNWTSSAWGIPKGNNVPAKGLLAVMLPKNAFALNNSGIEKIKLFSPLKQLIDSASFKDSPENRSWALNSDGVFEWGIPTFEKLNSNEPEKPKIFISEIFPQPQGDEEEFIEIGSFSTTTVNMEGVVLQIGTRNKIFGAKDVISAGGYLVIYEDDLPARLSNSGQTLKLLDSFGRLVSEVSYGKAQAGMVFTTEDQENYFWTPDITPGEENIFISGEVLGVTTLETKQTSTKKPAVVAKSVSSTDVKKLLEDNLELKNRLLALQESVDALSQQSVQAESLSEEAAIQAINEPDSNSGKKDSIYIVIPALLGLAAVVVYYYKSTKSNN